MDILKHKGIRSTSFRESVVEIFQKYDCAISIHTIEQELGTHDRITLYRTIKTFTDKGLIHEVLLPNEEKKLAICKADCSSEGHHHEHIHFKCESCEEVYCEEIEAFPKLSLKGFRINSLEINAIGLCKNCH